MYSHFCGTLTLREVPANLSRVSIAQFSTTAQTGQLEATERHAEPFVRQVPPSMATLLRFFHDYPRELAPGHPNLLLAPV